MKLKILVKALEKLLGITDHGDEPRVDMYLPNRLLALAIVLLAAGIALVIFAAEVWYAEREGGTAYETADGGAACAGAFAFAL